MVKKLIFGGRHHISTFGFASTTTKTAVLALFLLVKKRSVLDGTNGLSSSKPCAYCQIVQSELKPEVVLATIIYILSPFTSL